jgi:hypothetical protein
MLFSGVAWIVVDLAKRIDPRDAGASRKAGELLP